MSIKRFGCPNCKGTGKAHEWLYDDPHYIVSGIKTITCPRCYGKGWIQDKCHMIVTMERRGMLDKQVQY